MFDEMFDYVIHDLQGQEYPSLLRSKKCIMCDNPATQLFCTDVNGATFTERYCDDCIKQEKHIKQSELMDNFDNLFIRKVPET